MLYRSDTRTVCNELEMVRNLQALAAGLAVVGADSSNIETCLLRSSQVDMIAQLTSGIVANPDTAVADSWCLDIDGLFGCSFGRVG